MGNNEKKYKEARSFVKKYEKAQEEYRFLSDVLKRGGSGFVDIDFGWKATAMTYRVEGELGKKLIDVIREYVEELEVFLNE